MTIDYKSYNIRLQGESLERSKAMIRKDGALLKRYDNLLADIFTQALKQLETRENYPFEIKTSKIYNVKYIYVYDRTARYLELLHKANIKNILAEPNRTKADQAIVITNYTLERLYGAYWDKASENTRKLMHKWQEIK